MVNMLRAELYKLIHSRRFKIFLIIDIGLSAAACLFFKSPDFAGSMKIPGSLSFFVLPVLSFFIAAMLAVYCSMDISEGFLCGTFRNAISSGMQRWQVYIAKLAASLLANATLVLFMVLVLTLTNTVLNGWQRAEIPNASGKAVCMTAACILLLSCYSSVYTAVSFLVRHPGVAAGINMLLLFIEIIAVIFQFGTGTWFHDLLPSTYLMALWPSGSLIAEDLLMDTLLGGLMLTAAVIAVTTVMGCLAAAKYEFK